jgi:hypothetical protein
VQRGRGPGASSSGSTEAVSAACPSVRECLLRREVLAGRCTRPARLSSRRDVPMLARRLCAKRVRELERVILHADQTLRARLPFALAEYRPNHSRRRPQATRYLSGLNERLTAHRHRAWAGLPVSFRAPTTYGSSRPSCACEMILRPRSRFANRNRPQSLSTGETPQRGSRDDEASPGGRELVRDATRSRLRHFHTPVTWAMQAPGSAKGSSPSASTPVPSSASAPLMRPRWTEQITTG